MASFVNCRQHHCVIVWTVLFELDALGCALLLLLRGLQDLAALILGVAFGSKVSSVIGGPYCITIIWLGILGVSGLAFLKRCILNSALSQIFVILSVCDPRVADMIFLLSELLS